jgi:signal transduction histidine kinase
MKNAAAVASEEQHFILSTLPPSLAQKRLALAVVLALLVAFVITAGPLSSFQPGRIDAFVPAYGTALFVTDLITAVLLFAQLSILRSRALLALASGYLFTALIVVPWTLTFPGVFTPGGLLGAGLNTTNWLYILWHAGFPMFVIAYALLKDADPTKEISQRSVPAGILLSVAMTVAMVCAATFLVTAGHALLPNTMLDPVHFSTVRLYIAGCQIVLSFATLIVLWVRRRSVLDLWLMVAMCASAIEVCLIAFPVPARFSIGWYAGRIYGLVSGSLLLFVLLYEITALYGQLLRAFEAQRREREARMMTGDAVAASIAHEVNQPLTAIVIEAGAGLRWVEGETPNSEEVKDCFKHIAAEGHRAGAIIAGIRAMYRKEPRKRISLDINDIVAEALALARDDLTENRIMVETCLRPGLPKIAGDPIQLQQVVSNLIANAIDAMAASDETRVLSVGSDGLRQVTVWVADTGPGIPSQSVERIFNPLFTTKSSGMGMGLSICRSIVESHDGELSVAPNTPKGAVFRFVLRAEARQSAEAASAIGPGA